MKIAILEKVWVIPVAIFALYVALIIFVVVAIGHDARELKNNGGLKKQLSELWNGKQL